MSLSIGKSKQMLDFLRVKMIEGKSAMRCANQTHSILLSQIFSAIFCTTISILFFDRHLCCCATHYENSLSGEIDSDDIKVVWMLPTIPWLFLGGFCCN